MFPFASNSANESIHMLTIQGKNETVSTGGKSGRKISHKAYSHIFLFVCSSTSALNSHNLFFTKIHKRQGQKQEHKVVFTRS